MSGLKTAGPIQFYLAILLSLFLVFSCAKGKDDTEGEDQEGTERRGARLDLDIYSDQANHGAQPSGGFGGEYTVAGLGEGSADPGVPARV